MRFSLLIPFHKSSTLFQPMDYNIYDQNVIFENNIRGTRTVGLFPYVKQIALLRTVGHLKCKFNTTTTAHN